MAEMSDHVLKTIEELELRLAEQSAAVAETKRFINQLCRLGGVAERYDDAHVEAHGGPRLAIRSDQFYGQPQATCVKEILIMRKALNQGPATVNEIYSALVEGGFAFDTKNDENAKRGLRISISKNTALFHKLPNSKVGLLEWYPNAKAAKPRKGSDAAGNAESHGAADTESAEEEP